MFPSWNLKILNSILISSMLDFTLIYLVEFLNHKVVDGFPLKDNLNQSQFSSLIHFTSQHNTFIMKSLKSHSASNSIKYV